MKRKGKKFKKRSSNSLSKLSLFQKSESRLILSEMPNRGPLIECIQHLTRNLMFSVSNHQRWYRKALDTLWIVCYYKQTNHQAWGDIGPVSLQGEKQYGTQWGEGETITSFCPCRQRHRLSRSSVQGINPRLRIKPFFMVASISSATKNM